MPQITIEQNGDTVPDSYLYSFAPTTNYGSISNVEVGVQIGKSTRIYRSILSFPLASIPAGSTINSAKLVLYANTAAVSNEAAQLLRITQSGWTEGNVTWNNYNFDSAWTSAGGDFTTTDSVSWSLPTTGGSFEITGLSTLVKDGINNRNNQLHIILKRSSESVTSSQVTIKSSEAVADRPQLVVDYTLPKTVNFGNPYNFTESGAAERVDIDSLDTSSLVVVYADAANSSHGTAKFGAVDVTSVNFYEASEFVSSGAVDNISVSTLDSSTFIVAYRDQADSNHGTVKIGTISGTSITFGSETEFLSSGSAINIRVASFDPSTFIVIYTDGADSNHGTAKIGTVNGTSITFGNEFEFLPSGFSIDTDITVIGSSGFVISYRDFNASTIGKVIGGTVSGTSITYGSEVDFGNATENTIGIRTIHSSGFVISYRDTSDGNAGKTQIGTLDGTSITFGNIFSYWPNVSTNRHIAVFDALGFIVGYADDDNSGYGNIQYGIIDSLENISFTQQAKFLSSGLTVNTAMAAIDQNRFIVAYEDVTNNNYGTVKIGTLNNQTSYITNLFISGAINAVTQISDSSNLALNGHAQISSNHSLYINGHSTVSGYIGKPENISFNSEVEFLNTDGVLTEKITRLSSSKFIIAYSDTSASNPGRMRVGTINGSSVTFGPLFDFSDGILSSAFLDIKAISSSGFVVAYADSTSTNIGTAKVGNVDGTTITLGSGVQFSSDTNAIDISISIINTSQFMVNYANGAQSSKGTSQIGNISGDIISFGPKYEFTSGTGGVDKINVLMLNQYTFIVGYWDGSDSFKGKVKIGHINGTSIYYDQENIFDSTGSSDYILLGKIDEFKFIVGYKNDGQSGNGTIKIAKRSGGTVSFGSGFDFMSSGAIGSPSLAMYDPFSFIVGYTNFSNGSNGTSKIGIIENDSIIFSGETEFLTSGGSTDIHVESLDNETFVVGYRKGNDSGHGAVRFGSTPVISLYIYGHEKSSWSLENYIQGSIEESVNINLYTTSHDITINSYDTYILGSDGLQLSSDLTIYGFDNTNYTSTLFMNSYGATQTSGYLYSIGNDILNDSINLFMKGSSPKSQSINLFLGGFDKLGSISQPSLFIDGSIKNTKSSSLYCLGISSLDKSDDLFINGLSQNISITSLFVIGNDISSTSGNLFVNGSDNSVLTHSLYCLGKNSIINNFGLFINGDEINQGSTSLYCQGVNENNSLSDLFIKGSILTSQSIQFFISGKDTSPKSSTLLISGLDKNILSIDLFLYGISTKTLSSSLFTNGFATFSNVLNPNLFINGSDTQQQSSNLYVLGDNTINASTSLFAVGHNNLSVSGDLFINPHNTINTSGDLFIRTPLLTTSSGTLFIQSQGGTENLSSTMFIRGPNQITLSGTLFAQGHSQYISSVDMFIHGDSSIQKADVLYTEGHKEDNSFNNLFISANDSSNLFSDLFIYGHNIITSTSDLFILAPQEINNNTNLFITSDGGSENISRTLFISGPVSSQLSTVLYLYGSQPSSSSIDLIIHGHTQNINSSILFIDGNMSNQKSDVLYTAGHIISNDSINIFTIGDVSISTSGNLFIPGMSPINTILSSSNLYISGQSSVSISDQLSLFIVASGINTINNSITIVLNGLEPKPAVSCPILDPMASIQIKDSLIQTYQGLIDDVIDQLGKNVLLEFDPKKQPCPNCLFDTVRNRSTGVYKIGGPRPFKRGRKCPYCKGRGLIETMVSKTIKCLIKWHPKDAEDFGISVSSKKSVIRLKTFLTEADDLIRARSILINHDIVGQIKFRAILTRGPIPLGLREDRYCISFWELI